MASGIAARRRPISAGAARLHLSRNGRSADRRSRGFRCRGAPPGIDGLDRRRHPRAQYPVDLAEFGRLIADQPGRGKPDLARGRTKFSVADFRADRRRRPISAPIRQAAQVGDRDVDRRRGLLRILRPPRDHLQHGRENSDDPLVGRAVQRVREFGLAGDSWPRRGSIVSCAISPNEASFAARVIPSRKSAGAVAAGRVRGCRQSQRWQEQRPSRYAVPASRISSSASARVSLLERLHVKIDHLRGWPVARIRSRHPRRSGNPVHRRAPRPFLDLAPPARRNSDWRAITTPSSTSSSLTPSASRRSTGPKSGSTRMGRSPSRFRHSTSSGVCAFTRSCAGRGGGFEFEFEFKSEFKV